MSFYNGMGFGMEYRRVGAQVANMRTVSVENMMILPLICLICGKREDGEYPEPAKPVKHDAPSFDIFPGDAEFCK